MMRAHAGWVGRDRGMVEHFTPKKRAEVYKAMVGVVMIGGMQFLLDLLDLMKSLLWKCFIPRSRTNDHAKVAGEPILSNSEVCTRKNRRNSCCADLYGF